MYPAGTFCFQLKDLIMQENLIIPASNNHIVGEEGCVHVKTELHWASGMASLNFSLLTCKLELYYL